MSARAWNLSLFLAAALTLCLAPGASAQSVYGYSSLDIESSYVTSYSETDLDYYTEAYYYVETDAYLFAGSSVVASGSSYSSVSLGTSTSLDTSYYIQTNHWIVADDDSPYCFSCIAGGWYYGSMTLSTGPDYDGTDDSGWIYVGTTYDYGDTDVSAPSISGVDYTYGGGNEVRGTSGYVILYGSDLTSIYADTSVYCSYCSVAYESEGQINPSYSIPLDTASGTLSDDIDVYVADGGDAYANFYVYDPAPSITSISPSTWAAGSATSVTISGSGFGSSPSVSFSDGYVSFSSSSVGDTSISGTVTVGSGDPGGSVTVTVSADAWGGGSFFQAGGGGSGSASSTSPQVVGPPSISGISPDSTLIDGGNTSVTISGIRFGSSCPTVNGPGGVSITETSCSSTSVSMTVSAGDGAAIGPYSQISLTTSYGTSNSVYFTVDGPYYMNVIADTTAQNSLGNPARYTVYVVYYTDHTTVAPDYTVAENFSWANGSTACSPTPSPGSNSCSMGAKTDNTYGTFQDKWDQLQGYSPSGCGITITDYWQACFASGTYTDTFGKLTGGTTTSNTTILGYTLAYPASSGGMPNGYPVPRI